jgi:hypothetical protein
MAGIPLVGPKELESLRSLANEIEAGTDSPPESDRRRPL